MAILIMVGAALLPSIFLLVFFIRSDRFPEPRGAILGTFFLGVAIVLPVLAISLPLGGVIEPRLSDPIQLSAAQAFLLAAIPEEIFKLAVLLLYCRRHKAFDEPMDGLVYGVTASLGFATFENLLYVVGSGDGWLGIAILRALTAVPGHALLGAIMGFYVARAHFEPHHAGKMLASALLVPILLHGLYDWGLLATTLTEDVAWILLALAMLLVEFVAARRLRRRLRRDQQTQIDLRQREQRPAA